MVSTKPKECNGRGQVVQDCNEGAFCDEGGTHIVGRCSGCDRCRPNSAYRRYRRTAIAEMADWHPGFDMTGVSVSEPDRAAGSPRLGDKIARNPANHADRWLVAAAYFADNFEPMEAS